jgi:uncharacterized membrane protein
MLHAFAAAAVRLNVRLLLATSVCTLRASFLLQIRQHLMPKRLRVLVLGSASAIAAGTDTAAAAGGGKAGGSSIKASSSSAASGGRNTETYYLLVSQLGQLLVG